MIMKQLNQLLNVEIIIVNHLKYFKNVGNDGETSLEYNIIECSKIGETSCIEVEKANGVYLISNYIETGDKKQLIQCSNDK